MAIMWPQVSDMASARSFKRQKLQHEGDPTDPQDIPGISELANGNGAVSNGGDEQARLVDLNVDLSKGFPLISGDKAPGLGNDDGNIQEDQ